MSGIAPDAPGLSSNKLKSEVPPPISTISTRRGSARVPVHPFPQGLGRAVSFEPAIEGRLRLLQEAHAGRETGFLRGVQREALRGGVERGRRRNGDLLRIEGEAGATAKRLSQASRRALRINAAARTGEIFCAG